MQEHHPILGDGASQGLFWLRVQVLHVGMMPFAMEVFAHHVGMDGGRSSFDSKLFFPGLW